MNKIDLLGMFGNFQSFNFSLDFAVKKQIDKYAVINYSLVSNPNFTDSYADVFIKVSVTEILAVVPQ